MVQVKEIPARITATTTQMTHSTIRNWRGLVTAGLWIVALGTHAILMPILARELYEEIFQGKEQKSSLFS